MYFYAIYNQVKLCLELKHKSYDYTSKPVLELAILNYIALWHTFKDRYHRVQIKSNILLTQVRVSREAQVTED